MRVRLIVMVMALMPIASIAQDEAPNKQPVSAEVEEQAQSSAASQMITIPAGTRIEVSLTSQITTKSKGGSTVRAVTVFPVTVGTQLAIPAGTYVEGTIDKISRGGRSGPAVQMHFTRILYANGYSLSIDGNNTTAKLLNPEIGTPEPAAAVGIMNVSYAVPQQQPPPPPQPGSLHVGRAIGILLASVAVAIVTAILLGHHGGGNEVLFESGWQFEIVLQSPLTVNAATVAAGSTPQ